MLRITVVILIILVGCDAKDTPLTPDASSTMLFSDESDFFGYWNGGMDSFFKPGTGVIFENSWNFCEILLGEGEYKLLYNFAYPDSRTGYLLNFERGVWDWDPNAPDSLHFQVLIERGSLIEFEGSDVKSKIRWEESVDSGKLRAWNCKYFYREPDSTLHLFEIKNMDYYGYGDMKLQKKSYNGFVDYLAAVGAVP